MLIPVPEALAGELEKLRESYADTNEAEGFHRRPSLVDPVSTVEQISEALTLPGGLLFARISAEPDVDRPQHIVRDFEPTFERLRSLGFIEVWRDTWLWGHQAFQKA